MSPLTISAKGQITLQPDLLQFLGLAPGQQVDVRKLSQGVLTLQAVAPRELADFVGCLPAPQRALSVEEMNQLIATGWACRK